MQNNFTPQHAEQLIGAWLGAPAHVEQMQTLSGGMVNQVLYVEFDREPGRAVFKVQPGDAARKYFPPEYANLQHLRAHDFPVPEPYFLHDASADIPFDVLGIEFWDAVNLGTLHLSRGETAQIEREMAEVLLALHSHQRDTYGAVDGPGTPSWAEVFAARVRPRYENIEGKINPRAFRQIDDIINRFDRVFAEAGPPTLVHGDVWVTNVMVARRSERGSWRLRGFVDPGALYADVEYELAYLEVFRTVGRAFFDAYTAVRPTRRGYELRRAAYWLNTMIIHVDHFGDAHYRANTEALAAQLAATMGK